MSWKRNLEKAYDEYTMIVQRSPERLINHKPVTFAGHTSKPGGLSISHATAHFRGIHHTEDCQCQASREMSVSQEGALPTISYIYARSAICDPLITPQNRRQTEAPLHCQGKTMPKQRLATLWRQNTITIITCVNIAMLLTWFKCEGELKGAG